jgi:hypothetical protein
MSDPGNGLVQIGIVKDDGGTLASEFEGDLLQVGLGSSLHDLATDEGGTGEGDLVYVHVLRNGSTDSVAVSCDDVQDA